MRLRVPPVREATGFFLGLAYLTPLAWILRTSLEGQAGRLTLDHYRRLFDAGSFDRYIMNSSIVAVTAAIIVAVTSSMAAFALRRFWDSNRRLVALVLIVGLFLPRGFTFAPIYQLLDSIGLVGSLAGVILVDVGFEITAGTVLILGALVALDVDILDAASLEGASSFQAFRAVAFPLSRPRLVVVACLTLIASWNALFVPLILTLSAPDNRTLSVGIYSFLSEVPDSASLQCAAGILLAAPVLCLSSLLVTAALKSRTFSVEP